jgi:Ni/Co efflux regulator RcnB
MMVRGDGVIAVEKDILMNKTVLALAAALVFAGGAANPAFAKHGNGNGHGDNGHKEKAMHGYYGERGNGHVYRGYAGEPYTGHKYKANGVRSPSHWDRSVVHDSNHNGISNHDENFGDRWTWNTSRYRYSQRHVYTAINPFDAPAYIAPIGYRYNRYSVGSMLPRGYYGDPYYIDYQPYSLPPPPYGYRWTRVGNDVYLVQTSNGVIADIVYSLFH